MFSHYKHGSYLMYAKNPSKTRETTRMNRIPEPLRRIALKKGWAPVLLGLLIGLVNTLSLPSSTFAQTGTGRVTGTVIDEKTGDPMIGANVRIEGQSLGAMVDLNGKYLIANVPEGTYNIVITMLGYSRTTIKNVQVSAESAATISVKLREEVLEVEGITVEAQALDNTEAALLKQRQKSLSISDAISAEDISRGGTSDAASAMSRVTGASVVDGKYVYIRGLGQRYSTAQLNGAQLPSADPNGQAVQMDIFSTNMLDNITTEKTFTPDKPGNFTGGSVNIKTKSMVDAFTMSFSSTTRINSLATLNDRLSYSGGNRDFFGVDDGVRSIPDLLADPNVVVPTLISAVRDPAMAQTLDALSKSFSGEMVPRTTTGSVGQSYSYSIGSRVPMFDRPLSLMGSVSFNRNVSAYNNGSSAIWKRVSSTSQFLNNERLATDQRGTEEALWGGLINATFQPSAEHELGANFLYNRSGEKTARYQTGTWPSSLPDETTRYETRVLSFAEREMRSLQLRGKHYFPANIEAEWSGSFIKSKQDEPDLRFFTNEFRVDEAGVPIDNSYSIAISNYEAPTRYYRDLDESNRDFKMDVTVPFRQWSGLPARIMIGGAILNKNHTFRERRFEFNQDLTDYNDDAGFFFSDENVGILSPDLQTNPNFTRFGNYIRESTELKSNFDGDQKIGAGYLMLDLPVWSRLKLITGARLEATRLNVSSLDTTLQKGALDNNDFLPSVNLVYQLSDNINLRGAYSRTLARPTFRELAPFASFAFVGDFIFVGNANLERTLINNLDLRWEWFTRPGEIYALSYFYKKFRNPIERTIVTTNGEIQFQNVDKAIVSGVEMEVRKRLDQIHPILANFQVGGNLSLVNSKVDIAPQELSIIQAIDSTATTTRNLQGQSPYVLNLDVMFDSQRTGTLVSLHYNIFGRRLSEVSLGGTPDVFEEPFGVLDLTGSQRIRKGLTFRFSLKNILDPDIIKYHPFNGDEYVRTGFRRGRTFSFGLSYSI